MRKNENVDVYNYTSNIFASSKKIKHVLDLIKNQHVNIALAILENCSKVKFASIIAKSIKTAIANGVHNNNFQKENLYLSTAYATKGRTIKRLFIRAKGVSNTRYKHVSHLYIGLKNKIQEK